MEQKNVTSCFLITKASGSADSNSGERKDQQAKWVVVLCCFQEMVLIRWSWCLRPKVLYLSLPGSIRVIVEFICLQCLALKKKKKIIVASFKNSAYTHFISGWLERKQIGCVIKQEQIKGPAHLPCLVQSACSCLLS